MTLARVECLKVIAAHVDLTTHLKHGRHGVWQPQRNLTNGADVLRHIFAGLAVATGGCLHQHTLLVTQTHGQAVKLGFGHIPHRCVRLSQAQFTADAGIKMLGASGGGVGFGADTEHGYRVAHRGKLLQSPATDTLSG